VALNEACQKHSAGFAGLDGKAVVLIPKAGSMSINTALNSGIPAEDAFKCQTRLAFVRHPIQRLISAYSFFSGLNDRGCFNRVASAAVTGSWQAWVDFILERKNKHWMPQHEIIANFPTATYRFEKLVDVWPMYFPVALPHKNRSERRKTETYRASDLERYYKKDLDLWLSL
jgi:hypothetical protein